MLDLKKDKKEKTKEKPKEKEIEKEKPILEPERSLKIFEKNENDDDIILKISSNITIDIYTLDSSYQKKITIPSSKKQFYQIDSKENGVYKIISGKSVTVRKDGMIYPKNETWYWYGNVGTTSPPSGNQKPTSIQISYTLGKSVISTTVGSNTYYVTINVLDYSSEYVEAKIDEFTTDSVDTNILFHKIEDYVTYKLEIENTDSYDYTLKSVTNIFKEEDLLS